MNKKKNEEDKLFQETKSFVKKKRWLWLEHSKYRDWKEIRALGSILNSPKTWVEICYITVFIIFLTISCELSREMLKSIRPLHIIGQFSTLVFFYFPLSPREKLGILFLFFLSIGGILFLNSIGVLALSCLPLIFLFSLLFPNKDLAFYLIFLVGYGLLDPDQVIFGLKLAFQLTALLALSFSLERKDLGTKQRLLIALFLIFLFFLLSIHLDFDDVLDIATYCSGSCIVFIRSTKVKNLKLPLCFFIFLTLFIGIGLTMNSPSNFTNIFTVLSFVSVFTLLLYFFSIIFMNKRAPRKSLIFHGSSFSLLIYSLQDSCPAWLQTRLVGLSIFVFIWELFLKCRKGRTFYVKRGRITIRARTRKRKRKIRIKRVLRRIRGRAKC